MRYPSRSCSSINVHRTGKHRRLTFSACSSAAYTSLLFLSRSPIFTTEPYVMFGVRITRAFLVYFKREFNYKVHVLMRANTGMWICSISRRECKRSQNSGYHAPSIKIAMQTRIDRSRVSHLSQEWGLADFVGTLGADVNDGSDTHSRNVRGSRSSVHAGNRGGGNLVANAVENAIDTKCSERRCWCCNQPRCTP